MADKKGKYSMFPPPDKPLPPPNSAVEEAVRRKKKAQAMQEELEKQQQEKRRLQALEDARQQRVRRGSADSDAYPLDLRLEDRFAAEDQHAKERHKQKLLEDRRRRLEATQDHRAGVVGLPPAKDEAKEPTKKHHTWKNLFKKGGSSTFGTNSLAHLSRFGPGRRAVIYGELPTTSAAAAGRY